MLSRKFETEQSQLFNRRWLKLDWLICRYHHNSSSTLSKHFPEFDASVMIHSPSDIHNDFC